jgi:hypothetical protein
LRESQVINTSNTAFVTEFVKNMARVQVGMFTKPGRFVTAIDRIRGRGANTIIFKMLNDRSIMENLMGLRGRRFNEDTVIAAVAMYGGSSMYATAQIDVGTAIAAADVRRRAASGAGAVGQSVVGALGAVRDVALDTVEGTAAAVGRGLRLGAEEEPTREPPRLLPNNAGTAPPPRLFPGPPDQ